MREDDFSRLPPCELFADCGALPVQKEIRYKGFLPKLHERKEDVPDE